MSKSYYKTADTLPQLEYKLKAATESKTALEVSFANTKKHFLQNLDKMDAIKIDNALSSLNQTKHAIAQQIQRMAELNNRIEKLKKRKP